MFKLDRQLSQCNISEMEIKGYGTDKYLLRNNFKKILFWKIWVMLKMKKNVNKMNYYQNVEEIKNRPDKSNLDISSTDLEPFFKDDIAFPEQVKTLYVDGYYDGYHIDHDNMHMFNNILKFVNVENLSISELRMPLQFWKDLSQTLTKLKILKLSDYAPDNDIFGLEENPELLDYLVKIPSLKSLELNCMNIIEFPKGPSNIETLKLTLIARNGYREKQDTINAESYIQNFSLYKNLKTLIIMWSPAIIKNYQILDTISKNCLKLETIISTWKFDGNELNNNLAKTFEQLLQLPCLKTFKVDFKYSKIVNDTKLIFKNIENLEINYELRVWWKEFHTQFPNLICSKFNRLKSETDTSCFAVHL